MMSLLQVKQVQPHDGFVFFANLLFFVFARLIYLDWFYLRFLSSKLVTQMTQVADGTVARGLGRSVCQAAWQVCLPSIPACLLLPRSRWISFSEPTPAVRNCRQNVVLHRHVFFDDFGRSLPGG